MFRKVKDRMYEHDFERAEKYLRSKFKAHFTEDGMKHWSEEAARALKYLDIRRKYMNYGFLTKTAEGSGVRQLAIVKEVKYRPYCLLPDPSSLARCSRAYYISALRARKRSAA